ncbi:MAG: glutamate-1-semialdehyde 2,1-aminomutase [Oligoflexia bacterium]|nr:glutamate-1-semialdehyde 2,1-aminomutase [Oligoflexia bacterium]
MREKSRELFERSKKVAPGGVHSPVRSFRSVDGTPIFFTEAQGPYLKSVDGETFIDYCQSFGPLMLGHRDPDIEEVVKQTVSMAWSFGAAEPYSLELAEWITSHVPWVEKLRFVCSGTEAVMSALRVARAATGRTKILKFDGCYHGHVDSLLVKAGSGLAGEASSDSAGVTALHSQETLVVSLNDDKALEEVWARHGHEIAAWILEPLPANYGLLIQREEFIKKGVELARRHGALVIFDEVISGFRVAVGGMAEKLGIKPDLVTYGKVIGGGFPVGAYGGRRDLMDLVAPQGPVYQAGTLSANPIGMRAGLATLKKIEREKVRETLRGRGALLKKSIEALANSNGLPLEVTCFESLLWIHYKGEMSIRSVSQIPANHKPLFNKMFHGLLNNQVYLAPSGFEVSFLSLAHSDEILNKTLDAVAKVFRELA